MYERRKRFLFSIKSIINLGDSYNENGKYCTKCETVIRLFFFFIIIKQQQD